MKKLLMLLFNSVVLMYVSTYVVGTVLCPTLKASDLADQRRWYTEIHYYEYGTPEYDAGWNKIQAKRDAFGKEGELQLKLVEGGWKIRMNCYVMVLSIWIATAFQIFWTVQRLVFVVRQKVRQQNRRNIRQQNRSK